MSRKAYIITFMLLAVTVVPVYLTMFFAWIIAPCCAIAFMTLTHFLAWDLEVLFLAGINLLYLAAYCGLFYFLARITFRWSQDNPPSVTGRLVFQLIVLFTVFSCSFLPIISGHSLVNDTGTYNFWTACSRFIQTFSLH